MTAHPEVTIVERPSKHGRVRHVWRGLSGTVVRKVEKYVRGNVHPIVAFRVVLDGAAAEQFWIPQDCMCDDDPVPYKVTNYMGWYPNRIREEDYNYIADARQFARELTMANDELQRRVAETRGGQ